MQDHVGMQFKEESGVKLNKTKERRRHEVMKKYGTSL